MPEEGRGPELNIVRRNDFQLAAAVQSHSRSQISAPQFNDTSRAPHRCCTFDAPKSFDHVLMRADALAGFGASRFTEYVRWPDTHYLPTTESSLPR